MRWNKNSEVVVTARADINSKMFDLNSSDVVAEIYNSRPLYQTCDRLKFFRNVKRYVCDAIKKEGSPAKKMTQHTESDAKDEKVSEHAFDYPLYYETPVWNGIRFVLINPKDEKPTGGIGFITIKLQEKSLTN